MSSNERLSQAKSIIVEHIQKLLANQSDPILVAIDGGSGSGKSTLAEMITQELDAALIPGDDFYSAHIPDAYWDSQSASVKVAKGIDWQRIRTETLEPLLKGQPAQWRAFDFLNPNPDGTYPLESQAKHLEPASLILLEGAYSCRPELTDLIDLSILIDTPIANRHDRLREREDDEFLKAWHARWDEAEVFYFSEIKPKSSFDLVVQN